MNDPRKPANAAAEASGRWQRHADHLSTTYVFKTFGEAIRFMASAVPQIDAMDHHPDWSNTHRRVHVSLSSHDVGGITERDHRLAAVLDRLYDEAGYSATTSTQT